MMSAMTHPSGPVANGQEVLEEERVPLNRVDRCEMGIEYTRHFLGKRLGFTITQPDFTALCTDHELVRLNTHTRTLNKS